MIVSKISTIWKKVIECEKNGIIHWKNYLIYLFFNNFVKFIDKI